MFFQLSEDDIAIIQAKMPEWLTYWKTCDLCFVPYPEKFLREKKFLEIVPKSSQKSVVLDTPEVGETVDEKREKMQLIEIQERRKIDAETKAKVTERASILAYFATLSNERQKEITSKITIPKIARNGEIILQNGIILALRDEWKERQDHV